MHTLDEIAFIALVILFVVTVWWYDRERDTLLAEINDLETNHGDCDTEKHAMQAYTHNLETDIDDMQVLVTDLSTENTKLTELTGHLVLDRFNRELGGDEAGDYTWPFNMRVFTPDSDQPMLPLEDDVTFWNGTDEAMAEHIGNAEMSNVIPLQRRG